MDRRETTEQWNVRVGVAVAALLGGLDRLSRCVAHAWDTAGLRSLLGRLFDLLVRAELCWQTARRSRAFGDACWVAAAAALTVLVMWALVR